MEIEDKVADPLTINSSLISKIQGFFFVYQATGYSLNSHFFGFLELFRH